MSHYDDDRTQLVRRWVHTGDLGNNRLTRAQLTEARTEILDRRSLLPLPDLATQCGQRGCDLAYLRIQHSHVLTRGRTYRHNPARAWWHQRTNRQRKFLIGLAGITAGATAILLAAALALLAAIGEFQ